MDGEKQLISTPAPDAEKGNGRNAHVNKKYKDRVIRRLFGDSRENALSLYNAVNNSAYTNAEDLQFNTIDDFLYLGMKNDFSFLLGTEVNLYEHQSTLCPNMPVRGFLYLAKVFDAYAHRNQLNIYGKKLQKFPTPDFVVFYNGEEEVPDYQELRLSDAFETPGRSCAEMTARVYNINYGRNPELMEKCAPLRGYAILVDRIRSGQRDGLSLRESVDRAVDACIRENILPDFLGPHRAEVIGMFLTEYDEEERLRLEKEESREEGREEGRMQGITSGLVIAVRNLMKNLGLTAEAAVRAAGIPPEEHQKYIGLVGQ